MFAVPGFASLTPDLLKEQTDVPSSSKKRKRGKDKGAEDEKVSSKKFEELWKKHVEPPPMKQTPVPKTAKISEKKKPKSDIHSTSQEEKQTPIEKEPRKPSQSQEDDANGDIHPSRANLISSKDQPSESKSKRSNKRRKKAKTADAQQEQPTPVSTTQPSTETSNATISKSTMPPKTKKSKPPPPPQSTATTTTTPSTLTPLQAKMHAKLLSARFRHLNEQLYTTPSTTSSTLFSSTPSFFSDYHAGFAAQVASWPENPVAGYIDDIKRRAAVTTQQKHHRGANRKAKAQHADNPNLAVLHAAPATPLPLAHGQKSITVADLGAGTAPLAAALQADLKRLNLRVLSYDLHAANALVTKADMARLPLEDASVDVAIFCLALMGTNWLTFVEEAWRVLRWRGELWVAEIKSRFARNNSKGSAMGNTSKGKTHATKASASATAPVAKSKEQKAAAKEAKTAANNATLAVEVDGAPAGPSETTDVGPFVAALRRRGFALDDRGANTEAAVDMGNRMFVKMRFVKVGEPTRGKCVGKTTAGGGERGKKAKFLDDEGDMSEGEEAQVLKPCVYKLR